MRSRRRGFVGVAVPAGLLLLLLATPVGAQNLLKNPDFTDGIDGWTLGDLTQVEGFPVSGGVDLVTTNPGAGGLLQCVGTGVLVLEGIGPGQTRSVGQVLTAMQVPAASEDTILVFARVTSGNAAIAGAVSVVDATTRDGSVIEMSRADF